MIYKGRGALGNPQPRFLKPAIEAVDDGWYREEVPDSIATQVRPEAARSIITRNDSPDIPFEQSINPYRGCEHGCPYCYPNRANKLAAVGQTAEHLYMRTLDRQRFLERQGHVVSVKWECQLNAELLADANMKEFFKVHFLLLIYFT